ncbi:MAG: VOC family protein [Leptospiraceae bacterium]|nr:VOC family protein [Leptospiraceae bacterium]
MSAQVIGIGGIFFRSHNPDALADWYREHLGITPPGAGKPWESAQGVVVLAPFQSDSDYFPTTQSVMLNFRVRHLDQLLDDLKRKGVRVDPKRQSEEYGSFAWIYDCEDNKIELWEPVENA